MNTSKFKVGDKVVVKSIDVIAEVHDYYWPNDAFRTEYINGFSSLGDFVFTIDSICSVTFVNNKSTYCLTFKENRKLTTHYINDSYNPEEMFELYEKPVSNDNVSPIFGMIDYQK